MRSKPNNYLTKLLARLQSHPANSAAGDTTKANAAGDTAFQEAVGATRANAAGNTA